MTKKGIGSHQKSIGDNQVWLTPKFILDALGPFDLDPCAAPEPRPWNTAAKHIIEKEDSSMKLKLDENANSKDILSHLASQNIEINKFELDSPSLNQIFIELVRKQA